MFEIIDQNPQEAVIRVIGVGGCGGNAVEHMIVKGLAGVEFIAANTDAQALKRSTARVQLQLGSSLTRGLGAAARPGIQPERAPGGRARVAEGTRRWRTATASRRSSKAPTCFSYPRAWVEAPARGARRWWRRSPRSAAS